MNIIKKVITPMKQVIGEEKSPNLARIKYSLSCFPRSLLNACLTVKGTQDIKILSIEIKSDANIPQRKLIGMPANIFDRS